MQHGSWMDGLICLPSTVGVMVQGPHGDACGQSGKYVFPKHRRHHQHKQLQSCARNPEKVATAGAQEAFGLCDFLCDASEPLSIAAIYWHW